MQNEAHATPPGNPTKDENSSHTIEALFEDLVLWIHPEFTQQFEELKNAFEISSEKDEKLPKSEVFKKIEPWLQIDIFRHFDPSIILKTPVRKWASVLRELPGFLVFIPITWTWLCLSQAAGAFFRLTQSNPNMKKYPFLTLWNDGFNGELPTYFGFREFASVAAFFTLLILFVILSANFLLGRWDWQDQDLSKELRRKLSLYLDIIDRQFSTLRLASPLRFAQSLNQTATALLHLNEAALKNLNSSDKTVESLNSISEGISNYMKIMNIGLTQIEGQLKDSTEANTALSQSIKQLPQTFAEITKSQKQKIELELEKTLRMIGEDLSKTRNWSTAQLTALQGLADFVSQLAEKIPELQSAAKELEKVSRQSRISTGEVSGQFEKLIGTLQIVVNRLEKLSDDK